MARRWEGPFIWRTDDTRCIKCDEQGRYRLSVRGLTVWVCREHAIEAMQSKEGGGYTLEDAKGLCAELDREEEDRLNTRTSRWIPVAESMPEDGVTVMQAVAGRPGVASGVTHKGVWWDVLCGRPQQAQPTHWMELPAPPVVCK
jgi:hypothetical protein